MSPNDMNHNQLELMMMDYISGRMDPEQVTAFNQLMTEHPEYSQELVELEHMMALFAQHDSADIPEPSELMDENFYAMLHDEVAKENSTLSHFGSVLKGWFQLPQLRRMAYGFSFMIIGVFIGHYLHLLNGQSALEASRLAIKDQQIKALTVLSLLDMPSANKRLLAVNLAGMSEQPNDSIMEALLVTLRKDNNVNVRLEALEVLAQHTELESVRSGLVQAINFQDSPMVQMALANLMLQLNEQQAVEPIQRLLKQPELIEPVRAKLNEAINELI